MSPMSLWRIALPLHLLVSFVNANGRPFFNSTLPSPAWAALALLSAFVVGSTVSLLRFLCLRQKLLAAHRRTQAVPALMSPPIYLALRLADVFRQLPVCPCPPPRLIATVSATNEKTAPTLMTFKPDQKPGNVHRLRRTFQSMTSRAPPSRLTNMCIYPILVFLNKDRRPPCLFLVLLASSADL